MVGPSSLGQGGRTWTDLAVLAALYVFLMAMTVASVDFGPHWDEMPHKVANMAQAVDKGLLLPGNYEYPSLWFDIGAASLAPDFTRGALKRDLKELDPYAFFLDGITYLRDKFTQKEFIRAFLLKNRLIFAALSLTAMGGVYLIVSSGGGGRFAALAGAALCAASFELFYQSRWIAPDTLMTALVLLSGALAALAAKRGRPRLAIAAAAAAGLACGAKYPGGLFIVTPLIFLFAFFPGYGFAEKSKMAAVSLLAFTGAFLATTPGAIFEPVTFVHDVAYQFDHYKELGHGPATVLPGLAHLEKLGVYLSRFALSPYPVLALCLTGLAGLGLITALTRGQVVILALLAVPAAYLAFFAMQRVMVVRNVAVLIPFLAILAGLGAAALRDLLARLSPHAARGFTLLLAACLAANLTYISLASLSVAGKERIDLAKELEAYLASHPDKTFYLSPSLRPLIAKLPNLSFDRQARADGLIFHLRDDEPRRLRNKPDLVLDVIGPRDVNVNYYNDWIGLDRFLVYNPVYFRNSVPLARLARSVPAKTPWSADYVRLFFEDGLTIVCDGPQKARQMVMSLAKDNGYRIEFFLGDALVAQVRVNSPARLKQNDDFLGEVRLDVPQEAAAKGFDTLRIVPVTGKGETSLGHLELIP